VLDPTVRPIIVQAVDATPARELGLGEVILQAIGLAGIILIGSVAVGLVLGLAIIWLRKRRSNDRRAGEAGDQIRLRLEAPVASERGLSPAVPGGDRP
jgi:hypothetical protein